MEKELFYQRMVCLIAGHRWSAWRSTKGQPSKSRFCNRCDKRQARALTLAEHDERDKKLARNRKPKSKPAGPTMSVDEAVAYCGIPQSNALHWALGQVAALEWERQSGARVFQIKPKTDKHAVVPAGHFKRIYPFSFIVPLVMRHHEYLARQMLLFSGDSYIEERAP